MKKQKKGIKSISIRGIICIILAMFIIYNGGKMMWAATVDTTTVVCNDKNLYQSLKTRLSKNIISSDDTNRTLEVITDAIPNINELDLSNCQISDLSGIENFTSLTNLNLSRNSISNISCLSSLNNLNTLNLSNNVIGNVEGIKELATLTTLNLNSNKISNIQPIGNLTSLRELDISNNVISSASTIGQLTNLTSLNISQNSSFANLKEVMMPQLIKLNVSDTAINNIEGIKICRNLEELNLGNNDIETLSYLFETEKIDNETVAILRGIKKLDVRYTTKTGFSFSGLKKITSLTELYAQGNELTSITGVAELANLEYLNLDDNSISSIEPFRTTTTENGIELTKDLISAKQISLKNNEITDISVLSYLPEIEYLNLAENHVRVISPIEKFTFTKGLDLRNQTIDMSIYQKKNNDNHYVILLNIMQSAKNPDSKAYSENAYFTTENVTLNSDAIYNVAPYYNVIITPDKTKDDTLSITLHGGVADGTKINFVISTSTTAIETLRFEDQNLDAAIYNYFLTKELYKNTYIARAPYIINITQKEIANTKELDLSNFEIQKLKGLSNFYNLENLNVSNNKISDDSEIAYLTKMKNLNFANNQLNNHYTSIERLYSLVSLDITGNNIQDLNSIDNLIANLAIAKKDLQLTELTLSNNKLNNIEIVSKISTLHKLNISNNNITNINPISVNTLLDTLNISGNDIEDVSVLSNLKSMRTLYMSNNLIEDISSITNLSLTSLDVSGNRIVDITPISYQTSLTDLLINNNRIEDISKIEYLLLRGTFEAKQQKIAYVLGTNSAGGTVNVELPPIFKSAKDTNSKVYTTGEFSLENCELSSDGQSIQIDADNLGDKIATISITGGQADRTTFSVAHGLEGTITYNITDKTNNDVVATISFNREGARILNNEGNNIYTFTKNGEFTFIYQDEYGFSGKKTATVTWIDKEGPNATVTYTPEGITNQDVLVTVTTNEKVENIINGWTFTNEEQTQMAKTYSQKANETIELKDKVNNTAKVDISVQNIDKEQPVISGVENNKTYENDIIPRSSDTNLESVTLTKNGQTVSNYKNGNKISENGEYIIVARDLAGNETTVRFIIEKKIVENITSPKYEVDNITSEISKISPNTKLTSFKSTVESNVGYKVKNKEGKELTNGELVGTGYKLITDTGKEYTIIVSGDVNSDGKISLSDVSIARKHILKIATIKDEYEKAADLNDSNSVSLSDISIMRKAILGLQSI